jgi:uncharacterized delta-60 repeat protein
LTLTGPAVPTTFAASGHLDPLFAPDGFVTTDFHGLNDEANGVIVQSDGTIVAVGSAYKQTSQGGSSSFALALSDANGMIQKRITTGNPDIPHAMLAQPGGKILVVGTSNHHLTLARRAQDGSIDTSFGSNGIATAIFGSSTTDESGNAIALQSDGKIVVAGRSSTDIAVARFTSDGRLDTSFSFDGKVTTSVGLNDSGNALVIQADGKILVVGTTFTFATKHSFALVRYTSTGSIDTTFGNAGVVITDGGSANAVVSQTNGDIVVLGTSDDYDVVLARYSSEGIVRFSFGTNGVQTIDFGGYDYGKAITNAPDNTILIAGYSNAATSRTGILARLSNDGILDTTFADDGKMIGLPGQIKAIAFQADGKIVAAGSDAAGVTDFAIARYTANGALDTTFGGGILRSIPGLANTMALQPDGKIIIAGNTLVRYTVDGTLDTTFGNGGQVAFFPFMVSTTSQSAGADT